MSKHPTQVTRKNFHIILATIYSIVEQINDLFVKNTVADSILSIQIQLHKNKIYIFLNVFIEILSRCYDCK